MGFMSTDTPDSSPENAISELVGALAAVDENGPSAAANETSISDNNGNRIELGHESPNTKNIKKE
jgi:hypothetical protein